MCLFLSKLQVLTADSQPALGFSATSSSTDTELEVSFSDSSPNEKKRWDKTPTWGDTNNQYVCKEKTTQRNKKKQHAVTNIH